MLGTTENTARGRRHVGYNQGEPQALWWRIVSIACNVYMCIREHSARGMRRGTVRRDRAEQNAHLLFGVVGRPPKLRACSTTAGCNRQVGRPPKLRACSTTAGCNRQVGRPPKLLGLAGAFSLFALLLVRFLRALLSAVHINSFMCMPGSHVAESVTLDLHFFEVQKYIGISDKKKWCTCRMTCSLALAEVKTISCFL
jgi:hypothetical protein